MKKQLLSLMLLLFSGASFSQVIWSENFDASTSLPTGWAQYNVDGLTPNTNVSFLGTNARVVRPKTTGGTDYHVASTSWYTPAGTSNDWLVTPSITVPASGVYILEFDAIAPDPSYPDGFKVYVSATGNQVTDFTTAALTVAAGPSTYTTQQLNLSQWAGQTIYIAVQNNSNDMYLLYVDNFKVRMLQADDAILQSSTLNRYSLVNNNNNLVLSVKNDGYAPISNITVNWNDGSTDHSEVITTSIAAGATATVTHPVPVNYATVVEKSIDVTITNVNGNADLNPDNNADSNKLFNTVSQQLVKKVLIEEGTGTWCGWCPRGAVAMEYMYSTYPDNFIGVAVHNNDPMTVTEYDAGANFSGFPGCNVDRVLLDQSVSQTAMEGYYNARKNLVVPASVAIQMTSTNPGDLTFDVTSTFKTVYAAADLRLGVIIIEDGVTGTTSGYDQHNYYSFESQNIALNGAGHNWQTEGDTVLAANMVYNHVGRTLLGGYSGLAGTVPSVITDGTVASHSFTYTVPSTSNIANMYAVAVLVDQTTGEVLNADKIWLSKAGLNNLNLNNYFSVYPNPATDILTVDFEASNNDDYAVSILDLQGRVISSQNLSALNGAQKVTFDVNSLAKGSYVVTVSSNGMISTKNVVIK